MIHLDTNALIALPQWVAQKTPMVMRVVNGEAASVCAVVWYEYLVGPLDGDEAEMARAFLQGGIQEISEADAELAARLYNDAGRSRRFKTDALIASSAIRAGAELVTLNADDFKPFVGNGLRLMPAMI
ncbi:type II toxin-antitoxin system VapC family toxin [Salinisphaera sp.]|uniref:type II toxin-antitoxin system VapC family toxin n=1 Tax=Salinisphaera sp. TaxID=1914330 RepID=UPI002D782EBD|nr:PIN domain-containing protein [Salinisphaera sp.]HET7313784.1 PIN domain-containing protein [Salinisphaera sp.]